MTVTVKRCLDAVVAGHACVDIVPAFDAGEARKPEEIFRAGKLTDVGAANFCLGGAAPNVGVALAKLGARVCFVARLGDDLLGRLTRDLLQQLVLKDTRPEWVDWARQELVRMPATEIAPPESPPAPATQPAEAPARLRSASVVATPATMKRSPSSSATMARASSIKY